MADKVIEFTTNEFKTIDDLVHTITDGTVDYSQIGRDFFAQNFDRDQTAIFFRYLIDEKLYEPLCSIIHSSCINRKTITPDYLSGKSVSSLESRYFNVFLKMAFDSGLTLNDIMPLIVASFSASKNSMLKKWNESAEKFLEREARKDFLNILSLLTEHDKKYKCYEPLIRADKDETIEVLIKRLLFEKHIDKVAIRRFLLSHKVEVTENLEVYQSSNVKVREAVVRLLLLFKHNHDVADFLEAIKDSEKSVSVLRLVNKEKAEKITGKRKGKKDKKGKKDNSTLDAKKTSAKTSTKKPKPLQEGTKTANPISYFFDLMLSGQRFTLNEFKKNVLSVPQRYAVAETLFFSVYKNEAFKEVVVVENGQINNLDNQPVILDEFDTLQVMHPADLPKRFDFIKRLNIEQAIDQIKRGVYEPVQSELSSGISVRFKGNIVSAKAFKKDLKRLGYRFLESGTDGLTFGASKQYSQFVSIISFSKTNFDNIINESITLGDLKFYRNDDLIKINGKIFTDNVPLCTAKEIGTRIFSEMIADVYELIKV